MNESDTRDQPPPGTLPAPRFADLTRLLDEPDPATGTGGGTLSDGRAGPGPAAVVAIPGYELLGVLGRGAMGEVHRARQVGLNRVVALKMVLAGPYADPAARARFLIEAEAAAAVDHPNVVRVHEYGEHAGHPYLAMEYLPGGTLAERLGGGRRVAPGAAADLLAGVARGVAAAHALGIVHRDLKPANILFAGPDAGAEPKVGDFGIAKRGGVDLTRTVAVLGTPAYMAPEQARGDAKYVSPAADVWALGVILYECLYGQRPFRADDVDVLLAQIRSAAPAAAPTAAGVPRELDLICRKCLEKVPADRYPTAGELVADLDRFRRGEPVSVRPLRASARAVRWARRNPALAGLFAVVALFAAGLGVSLVAQYRQAVAAAEFERRAKEEAEQLAAENAALARQEAEAKEQAQKLAADNAALAGEKAAEAERANQVSGFLTGLFRGTDPLDIFGDTLRMPDWQAQRAKTAGVLLREAADKFRDELKGQPLARAKLLEAVGDSLANLGDFRAADPLLREAVDLRQHLPPAHPDRVRGQLTLGRVRWQVGDYPAAHALFRDALAGQQAAGAAEADTLATRLYLAVALSYQDPAAADPIFGEVIAGWERLRGPGYRDTLVARSAYAAVLLDSGRTLEALALFPKILDALRTHPDPRFRTLGEAITAFQAGVVASNSAGAAPLLAALAGNPEAKFREALAKGEQVPLPPDHWVLSIVRFELAGALAKAGKDAEADALYARILADVRRTTGLAHPKVVHLVRTMADRAAGRGRPDEARRLWDQADAANLAQFGRDNHWRGVLLLRRAHFEARSGAADPATTYAAEAADLLRAGKLFPNKETCLLVFHAAEELARPGLSAAGKDAVRRLFAFGRPFVDRVYGAGTREEGVALRLEGAGLYRIGDRADGAARLAEAERLAGKLTAADDWERRDLWYWSGAVREARGEFAEAAGYAAKALAVSRRNDWPRHRADDAWRAVRAHVGAGTYADALSPLRELRRWEVEAKAAPSAVAWVDLVAAASRLGAGDRDGYRKAVGEMVREFGAAADVNTSIRVAWAVGLSPDADPAVAAKAAALKQEPGLPWGRQGLALARLRAGDPAAAVAALGPPPKAGGVPLDGLVRGLCAAARGDTAAAEAHLRAAEAALAALRPSDANPFAFADSPWDFRLFADLLRTELRAAVAPPVAPPPRPRG